MGDRAEGENLAAHASLEKQQGLLAAVPGDFSQRDERLRRVESALAEQRALLEPLRKGLSANAEQDGRALLDDARA